MIPQEIDALESGRELDALIAEKVFGWAWVGWDSISAIMPPDFRSGKYGAWAMNAETSKSNFRRANDWDTVGHLQHYSTDIAAAWAIAEKHLHYFSLTRSNDTNWQPAPFGPIVWRCRFYAPEKFEAVADTAPLAICRAALKAVLVEQPTA